MASRPPNITWDQVSAGAVAGLPNSNTALMCPCVPTDPGRITPEMPAGKPPRISGASASEQPLADEYHKMSSRWISGRPQSRLRHQLRRNVGVRDIGNLVGIKRC